MNQCPYCAGSGHAVLVGVRRLEYYVKSHGRRKLRSLDIPEYEFSQDTHDKACPARQAPLGSAFGLALDLTAEMALSAGNEGVVRLTPDSSHAAVRS